METHSSVIVAVITVVGGIVSTWGAIILNRRVNGSANTRIMELERENARLRKSK